MRKYEIYRVVATGIIDDVNIYEDYYENTDIHGSMTIEAPNLYRAIVMMRKQEMRHYDEIVENNAYYDYPDFLEAYEIDKVSFGARKYFLEMRDM